MSKNFMTSLFLTFQSLQTFTKKRISTFLLRLLPKISRFKLSKKPCSIIRNMAFM